MDARSIFEIAFGLGARVTAVLALTTVAVLLLRRGSAATRHLVAVAGLSAALALPLLSGALPALELAVLPPQAAVHHSPKAALDRALARALPAASTPAAYEPAPGLRIVERAKLAGQLVLVAWVALAWLAVTLLLLARLGAGLLRLARIERDASEERHFAGDVMRCSDALGLHRFVRLIRSPRVQVPMTAGVFEPVVILPESSAAWTAERRRFVLLHELAHVKRFDWLSLLVSEIATAFWWFHPLAWVALRAARLDAEKATDDLVLRAGEKPSAYAGHLIDIVRSMRGDPAVVGAMPMARPSDLEGRLRALLDRKGHGPASWAGRLFAGGLVVAALALAVVRPVHAAQLDDDAEFARPGTVFRTTTAPLNVHIPDIKVLTPMARFEMPAFDVHVPEMKIDMSRMKGDLAKARTEIARARAELESSAARMNGDEKRAELDRMRAQLDELRVRGQAEAEAARAKLFANNRFTWSGGWDRGADAYSRGMELHRRGHFQEAIEQFKKAIERGEREDAATYNIACGYARLGDKDRAFEWLRKAEDVGFDLSRQLDGDDDLDSLRDDPRYHKLAGEAREERDDDGEARRLVSRFDRLRASGAKSPGAFDSLGKELLHKGEYDASAKAFQEAAARSDRPGTSLYNAACALSRKGDKGAALDLLEKALDAGFDDAHLLATDDDLDNIRREPRFKDLQRLAEDTQQPSMSFGSRLGAFFGRHHGDMRWQLDDSTQRLEKATRDHPNSGKAFYGLGLAKLEKSDYDAASKAFTRALELGYRKPATLYNLACVEARRDAKDRAFRYLDQAIDAGFVAAGQLRSDEDLDNLRGDPRYRDAIRKADAKARTMAEDD